ncbi:J domain-containing protein [Arthrobacter sp. HS15c]|uniref:J domain-containing protein n=1 Tax=Arthrobacter sp. HS15c TaxID=3230279 RepID=UPI0034651621
MDSRYESTGNADGADLPDHYAALQVPSSASQREIARAYRALMRNFHPDVDGATVNGATPAEDPANDSSALQRPAEGSQSARRNELLRIMQAFAVLRDPGRRAAYDRSRARSQVVSRPAAGPQDIPVQYVRGQENQPLPTIRITPVRWESGPWA